MTNEEIKNAIKEAREFAIMGIIKWLYECDLHSNKAAIQFLGDMAGGSDNYLKHWEPLEEPETRGDILFELRDDLLNELCGFRAIKKSHRVALSRILSNF